MEISADKIVDGLLEEIKRLTVENIALKIALSEAGKENVEKTNS